MLHIFKYRFLCFIKDKTILFWGLVFPIVLSTLFYFAFSNLSAAEKLEPMEIAVVDKGNEDFKQVLNELSDKNGDNHLFNLTYTTEKEAEKLIENNEVKAGVVLAEKPSLLYGSQDMETEILKSIIQEYTRVSATIASIAQENPVKMDQETIAQIVDNNVVVNDLHSSAGSVDFTTTYYYTVIAMTVMYGAFWGLRSVSDTQANQSARAIRLNVAPTHKMKMILMDYLVSFIILSVEIAIVFAYLTMVLGVDFGEHFGIAILVTACGALMSLAMGIMIGCVSKLRHNSNITIISMGTVFSCFLAGMMVNTMPYMLDKTIPFLKYINPATLISQSYSILYYYEDISAVYTNIAILLGMGALCILLAYNVLRRKAYASI